VTGALRAVLDAWAASEGCAVRVRRPDGTLVEGGAPPAGWRPVPLGGDDEPWGLEVAADAAVPAPRLTALAVAIATLVAADEELAGAARELIERYEEIDLLYRVGDLLGSTVRIEDAAGTMLRELAETIGARRAALYVSPPSAGTPVALERLAVIGAAHPAEDVVAVLDPSHPAAAAFRECLSLLRDGRDGAATILAVPLLRVGGDSVVAPVGSGMTGDRVVAPGGGLLGAIVLEAPRHEGGFSAGDRKLASAVATQVATALHNARLVEQALAQQRLEQELRLAHDLQLALLSDPRLVGPEADAAAHVLPAERVGGDFYLLKRLDAQRTAVLVGDVAGHGYRAALMMAAAVATASAHAEQADEPAQLLRLVEGSLRDELEGTEMSLSLCCAVLDAARGEVRFANAGHPHAFILQRGDDGRVTHRRLAAMVPPLGIAAGPPTSAALRFDAARDMLVLFTDGAVDARDAAGARVGEARVLAVMERALAEGGDAAAVAAAVVDEADRHRGPLPLRDDLAVVAVRRVPGR
jgi:sigma-B regulation protein RsbU (phosphoserine phosphatase)